MDCCYRPVDTIVYIFLIIFDRIECFYSLTPETHIFMPQKCDISVWPIATPSAIINTCLHHTGSITYILYQISEVLIDMHK